MNDDIRTCEPFYFVRDRRPVCRIRYAERPFPPEIYIALKGDEVSHDVSYMTHNAAWRIYGRLMSALHINDYTQITAGGGHFLDLACDAGSTEKLPLVYIGKTDRTDFSLLGDATPAQFAVGISGGDLHTAAQTPLGFIAAADHIADSIRISEDGRDAYLPPEAMGVFERPMPPVVHAFPRTTISFYGPPHLGDDRVLSDILAFGADEIPMSAFGVTKKEDVDRVRALINKYYAHGVTTRLYAIHGAPSYEATVLDGSKIRAEVKEFVDRYSDLDGISQWGYFDEPSPNHIAGVTIAKQAFYDYDPKHRPVYINIGPSAHVLGCENFYNRLARELNLDYYCLDRYPFHITERGDEMADPYFYAHLELNRNYAVDYGRDCGLILAAIKVGGEDGPGDECGELPMADMNDDFMRWQTNLLLAYGHRYLEQYVYYHVHDYCMLGEGDVPTFRWHIAQRANRYVKTVGRCVMDGRTVDAVFHLPKPDGSYDFNVIPYYGYRGAGDVRGVDAALSFLDDGTLIVTDKRCDAFHGGDHDVTVSGLKGALEWFNAETASWEDIASCPAARVGGDGLTLTLTRASQYIVRPR
jgi:hypothetical protein